MQTKLTLRLDDALIHRAKRYAQRHDQSVSQLVANFFSVLAGDPNAPPQDSEPADDETPAIVEALHGCLAGAELDESDYRRHLEQRYT